MATWSREIENGLARATAHSDPEEGVEEFLRELAAVGAVATSGDQAIVTAVGTARAIYLTQGHVPEDRLIFVESLLLGLLLRIADKQLGEQARERASMLSRASFEGILIHQNGVVIDVNESLAELLDCRTDELLGPDTMRWCIAPEDLPRVVELIRSGYEGTYVITGVRKNGSRFRAELQSKQGHWGQQPIRVAAVRDVTERERMLGLLRESEAQLRDLTEAVFDLTVLSRDGVIVDATGAVLELLGVAAEEVIGCSVLDFVSPAARPSTQRMMATGRSGSYRSTVLARDGRHVPVEVVATNTTLNGEPVRLSALRDRSREELQEKQRYQLQQQVERTQRLDSLGALAGGVAHDFNNLLVGILGNADLLLEDLPPGEPREIAEGIRLAGMRARELTQRLLTYAGRSGLGPAESLDLRELVDELVRFSAVTRPRNVEIAVETEEGCVTSGDRAAITQVLLNVFTNAVDALEGGPGSVTVRGRRVSEPDERWDSAVGAAVGPGNWVQLEVIDTGRGMDRSTLSRVFEPFFTTKAAGHGLGLAACLGTLDAHGGAIHVESELGVGSRFSLLLPLAEMQQSDISKAGQSSTAVRRVLILDDEPMVRKQICRALQRRGYDVFEAEDAATFLTRYEEIKPDLVITDMTMPGRSGAEISLELRERGSRTPIILTSGHVPSDELLHVRGDLFQAFLQKPYSIGELIAAIDEASPPR